MSAKQFPTRGGIGHRRGFSLIELLLVLAIIVIATSLFFGFASPNHQRIEQKNCHANLQKIFIALQIYANDSAARFPVVTNAETSDVPLDLLVPRYNSDTEIFTCPGSKDKPLPPGERVRGHKISYSYYMGLRADAPQTGLMSDAQVNTGSKRAHEQIFSLTGRSPGNNHSKFGGNVLFSDGTVELTPPRLEFPLKLEPGVLLLNPKR